MVGHQSTTVAAKRSQSLRAWQELSRGSPKRTVGPLEVAVGGYELGHFERAARRRLSDAASPSVREGSLGFFLPVVNQCVSDRALGADRGQKTADVLEA